MATYLTDPSGQYWSLSVDSSGQLSWTEVSPPPPPSPPVGFGGSSGSGGAASGASFSRAQLLSLAALRTESRASTLDQNSEFYIALQEICLERRWWWRRKVNIFNLVVGQGQYDLTDTSGFNAGDLQQVAKNGFKLFY